MAIAGSATLRFSAGQLALVFVEREREILRLERRHVDRRERALVDEALIWLVRVFSCATISGTVSGIGSGTSAGSMPTTRRGGDRLAAVAGAGSVSTSGAGAAGAVGGAALVIVGAATACGSFE